MRIDQKSLFPITNWTKKNALNYSRKTCVGIDFLSKEIVYEPAAAKGVD